MASSNFWGTHRALDFVSEAIEVLVYAPEKDWLFLTFFTVNVTPHAYHAGCLDRMDQPIAAYSLR